jgi:hypothetical protein
MSISTPGSLKTTPTNHQQLQIIDKNNISPILIVGMHNSGTSILAEIIHKSGIFLGNNMEHYESHLFSIYINDLLIMKGDKNWSNLPILSIDEVMSYRKTIGPFIKKHWMADYMQWGYDGISKWGIKDPRLCVLLPLYLDIFPEAKVVHIRRNPDDVAASLCQRDKRGVGKLDNFDHWRKLTLDYTERVIEYSNVAHAYHEIKYEEFCTNRKPVTKALFKFLNIRFSRKTKQLLSKVTPSRIGSYDAYLRAQNELKKGI